MEGTLRYLAVYRIVPDILLAALGFTSWTLVAISHPLLRRSSRAERNPHATSPSDAQYDVVAILPRLQLV